MGDVEQGVALTRAEIEEMLPHREPFLFVDRVIDFRAGEWVRAELDVDPEWDVFRGHFPGHPVMPGVLELEALAQTAGIALLSNAACEGRLGFLAKVDGAKFRRQVVPGDVLVMEAEILKASSRSARARVVASVAGEVACEAEQMYVMG